MTVMSAHFYRAAAMANGRVPFDAKAVADNVEIATYLSKLPFAGFVEGADKGEHRGASRRSGPRWSKFRALAAKMQEEMAKLNGLAKGGNIELIRGQVGVTEKAARPATTPTARSDATIRAPLSQPAASAPGSDRPSMKPFALTTRRRLAPLLAVALATALAAGPATRPTRSTPAACSRPRAIPWERRFATRSPAWRRCPARAATRSSSRPEPTAEALRPATPARAPAAMPATRLPRRAEQPPPPKPNEFQRFVEGATGRLLPIFGSAFFADAADTFHSLDNVPVSADYTIGPGDEIITRAWGSIDVDYRSTVDRNGMLNLPKVGSFNVAGVKAADLEKNLRAQIGAPLHQLRSLASRSASCAGCASSSSARRSGRA